MSASVLPCCSYYVSRETGIHFGSSLEKSILPSHLHSEFDSDEDVLHVLSSWLSIETRGFLAEPPKTETLNMLVLGPTGNGVSTFVNVLANFLTHSTYDECRAVEGAPVHLVPVNFTIFNDDFEECVVKLGNSPNEDTRSFYSCTRYPKLYRFHGPGQVLNVIDAPSPYSTSTFDFDEANRKKLLLLLTRLDKIHGICIMLSPGKHTCDRQLLYFFTELSTCFSPEVLKNVFFVFTHTQHFGFYPDDVSGVMNAGRMIKPSSNIIHKKNVTCIDNNWFRATCARYLHPGFELLDDDRSRLGWNKSREAVRELLARMRKQTPYAVRESVLIDEARTLAYVLQRFLPFKRVKNGGITNSDKVITTAVIELLEFLETHAIKCCNDEMHRDRIQMELYLEDLQTGHSHGPGVSLKRIQMLRELAAWASIKTLLSDVKSQILPFLDISPVQRNFDDIHKVLCTVTKLPVLGEKIAELFKQASKVESSPEISDVHFTSRFAL